MKKLIKTTILTSTIMSMSSFAHAHSHSGDSFFEMILHPFTGLDHILGMLALGAVTFLVVKKIKKSKKINK